MPLPQPPINLRPGTAIIKQWRGAQHVVGVIVFRELNLNDRQQVAFARFQ